jgi:two-component system, cell cycle response regulator CtrA
MKILVVEDDKDSCKYMVDILQNKNFVCESVDNGSDALYAIKNIDYDLVLLDIDIPYMDGTSVLAKVRNLNISTPIIVISSISSIKSKVAALELGCDDYIVKPFDRKEILARISSVKRRYAGFSSTKMTFGNLSIDTTTQIVSVCSQNVALTKKEYIILELLVTRKGSLVCKEIFLDHLYHNICDEPNIKIVDVFICKLRKKLKSHGANVSIKTIWSRGCSIELSNNSENQQQEYIGETVLEIKSTMN